MMWIKDQFGEVHETTSASTSAIGGELYLVGGSGNTKMPERRILLARGLTPETLAIIREKIEAAIVNEQRLVSI